MIVMKFGGTSVGSADLIRRVCEIIRTRLDRSPLVVVSAVAGTTDQLESLGELAVRSDPQSMETMITDILSKHRDLIGDLELASDDTLQSVVQSARSELEQLSAAIRLSEGDARQLQDALSSIGEFLSSHLLAGYLSSIGIDAVMADAREIMMTDSQFGKALPLMKESTERARAEVLPYLDQGVVPVMQGFIGKSQDGLITTLGRGGSDYSATLVAAMLDAEAVEIWTDVDGVMTADPTIIPDVKRIRRMTFHEAAELAYFGARVLHPATILPAIEQGIPVYVLNTMHPDDSGTEILPITENRTPNGSLVKAIVYKEGLTVITLKSTRMLMAYGFMASIFNVFNKYRTAVDLVSTSEVSVSITIDTRDHLTEIVQELNRFSEVEVQYGKAIVCVVGEKIKKVHGMPAEIFKELEDKEIHLISQGASEINISFVIDESEINEVVRRLHDKFFTGPINEEVFAAASPG